MNKLQLKKYSCITAIALGVVIALLFNLAIGCVVVYASLWAGADIIIEHQHSITEHPA